MTTYTGQVNNGECHIKVDTRTLNEGNHTGNDQKATKTKASDTICQSDFVYNVLFEIDSEGYITYTNPFGDVLQSEQPFPDNILEDMSFHMFHGIGYYVILVESLEYIRIPTE